MNIRANGSDLTIYLNQPTITYNNQELRLISITVTDFTPRGAHILTIDEHRNKTSLIVEQDIDNTWVYRNEDGDVDTNDEPPNWLKELTELLNFERINNNATANTLLNVLK